MSTGDVQKSGRIREVKDKGDPKGNEDLSLPPSAHVLEKLKSKHTSTPKPTLTTSTPKQAKSPKDAQSPKTDIDEDDLDRELKETEKSILEVSEKLEQIENQRRVKVKMAKLGKMKVALQKKHDKLKEAEEEDETKKTSSPPITAADSRKNKKLNNLARKKKSLTWV